MVCHHDGAACTPCKDADYLMGCSECVWQQLLVCVMMHKEALGACCCWVLLWEECWVGCDS
jgi:hypothetical protein